MQNRKNYELFISLIGGRIRAFRCQASSKRSKQQCKKAVSKGKRLYVPWWQINGSGNFHGKQRCAEAKTIHGRETRSIRSKRSQKLREIKFYFKLLY